MGGVCKIKVGEGKYTAHERKPNKQKQVNIAVLNQKNV